jgi:hypothetical protein
VRIRSLAVVSCALAPLGVGLGACGGGGGGGGGAGSNKVTVYSSLPFDPSDRQQTNDVVKGMRLALSQVS